MRAKSGAHGRVHPEIELCVDHLAVGIEILAEPFVRLVLQIEVIALGARALGARALGRGLSQEDAAESLGIGNEAVSRMERGAAMPSLERLRDFAKLYKCRFDQLLMEASDNEPDQSAHVAHLLSGLAAEDRQLVVGIVGALAERLRAKHAAKRKR